jgi:2-polyprenyl-3-methyl-5-hydroxy-6-metoxy-1,4-benzoquinol methylase
LSGPAIEIGCGTGLSSLGLVDAGAFPYVLLTDPSPKFLDITRQKFVRAKIAADKVGFGVLMGEELSRLPKGLFSLVLLRSVLHHVIDIEAFVKDAAATLKPGGMMIMEEPCQEGFVVLGTMAQFIPLVLEQQGIKLDRSQRASIQLFLDTLKFYCRRDVDKSTAEDKHLFRVDELMKMGERAGLTVDFKPNKTFYDYAPDALESPTNHSFIKFFHDYLKYAMRFSDDLMKLFNAHFRSYCQWIEDLAVKGNGPYMNGIFVCRKI